MAASRGLGSGRHTAFRATWRLEEVLCSHERSQHRKVDLYESGFYPIRMGEYLLKKALEELLREAPAVE